MQFYKGKIGQQKGISKSAYKRAAGIQLNLNRPRALATE